MTIRVNLMVIGVVMVVVLAAAVAFGAWSVRSDDGHRGTEGYDLSTCAGVRDDYAIGCKSNAEPAWCQAMLKAEYADCFK